MWRKAAGTQKKTAELKPHKESDNQKTAPHSSASVAARTTCECEECKVSAMGALADHSCAFADFVAPAELFFLKRNAPVAVPPREVTATASKRWVPWSRPLCSGSNTGVYNGAPHLQPHGRFCFGNSSLLCCHRCNRAPSGTNPNPNPYTNPTLTLMGHPTKGRGARQQTAIEPCSGSKLR